MEPINVSAKKEDDTVMKDSNLEKTIISSYKTAYSIILLIGCFTLLVSLLGMFVQNQLLQSLGGGYLGITCGIIYIVLGILVQKKFIVALYIAIAVYGADLLLLVAGTVLVNSSSLASRAGALFLHVAFLLVMIKGVSAIKAIKARTSAAAVNQSVQ